MKKLMKLKCIKEKLGVVNKEFTVGEEYVVLYNHASLISIQGESGYKVNLSKRVDDLNLPYLWEYFDEKESHKIAKTNRIP